MFSFLKRINQNRCTRELKKALGSPDDKIVLTVRALAQVIKGVHPCYNDLSDRYLAERFLIVYPEYARRIIA